MDHVHSGFEAFCPATAVIGIKYSDFGLAFKDTLNLAKVKHSIWVITHLNLTLNSKHVFDYQRNRNFYSSRQLQKNVAFGQSQRSMDVMRAYLIASSDVS